MQGMGLEARRKCVLSAGSAATWPLAEAVTVGVLRV